MVWYQLSLLETQFGHKPGRLSDILSGIVASRNNRNSYDHISGIFDGKDFPQIADNQFIRLPRQFCMFCGVDVLEVKLQQIDMLQHGLNGAWPQVSRAVCRYASWAA